MIVYESAIDETVGDEVVIDEMICDKMVVDEVSWWNECSKMLVDWRAVKGIVTGR